MFVTTYHVSLSIPDLAICTTKRLFKVQISITLTEAILQKRKSTEKTTIDQ